MVGDLRHRRHPRGGGDAQRAQLPGFDERQRRGHDRERAVDAAGDDVGVGRRGAAIGHVGEIDLGHVFEQLAAHVRRAAVSGRGERDLARALSGFGDQVGDRAERRGLRHDEYVGEEADQRDRGKVVDRIVVDRGEEIAVDGKTRGGDVHGVAVGGGAGDVFRGDVAAGARLVLHHHLLAPHFRQPRADDAADRVDAASGRERHDQLDETGGPSLRRRSLRDGSAASQRGRERGCC